jgi:hypothetical protein
MRNLFIGFLILAVVLIGGGIVASVAYQAGVSTAVTTVAASAPDGAVVTPVAPYPYPYGYGWGWGHGGFPFLGILAGLFFLFLLFALIRAATWRGPGWRGGGWGDHDHRSRFHDTFDEWHRKAHEGGSPPTS